MGGRLALWYHVYGSLWTAKNIQTNNLISENILSFHQFNRPIVSLWTVNCFDVYVSAQKDDNMRKNCFEINSNSCLLLLQLTAGVVRASKSASRKHFRKWVKGLNKPSRVLKHFPDNTLSLQNHSSQHFSMVAGENPADIVLAAIGIELKQFWYPTPAIFFSLYC